MFKFLQRLLEYFFPEYETEAKSVDWDSNVG
jgi:hypothetical protein